MIKPWLNNIERIANRDQINKIRLHSCERLQPFPIDLSKLLNNSDFMYYQSTDKLKEKIAKLHSVNPENIFIGNGSDSCIKTFVDLFEEGTEVWTTNNFFPMYKVYAELNNHKFKTAGFPIEKQVVLLSNPNSPLGTNYTLQSLQFSAKQNDYVLIDEAYIDYTDEPADTMSLINDYKNVVVTRTFSKGLGGAGCRVGYAIADSSLIEKMNKFRSMYELSGPSIKFAEYILDNYEMAKAYCVDTINQRPAIVEHFESRGYETFGEHGNWLHIEQTDALVTHLEKFAHIRKDCIYKGTDKWIRLTIGAGLLDYDFIQTIPYKQ